jgi:hypothetical protein
LGAICPNTLLAPQEVASFNVETQRTQDDNLQTVWSRMHAVFQAGAHPPADLPAAGAPAQEIRTWMRAEANQALLQGIHELNLSSLDLTCLPEEIGLCTALQTLDLSDNRLVSLPEGIFRGMTALQRLVLYGNPRLLVSYKDLSLENNREFLNAFDEFFNYQCQSPLARVYQLAAGANSLEAVRDPFLALPNGIKNDIYGKIWMEAGSPMGRHSKKCRLRPRLSPGQKTKRCGERGLQRSKLGRHPRLRQCPQAHRCDEWIDLKNNPV